MYLDKVTNNVLPLGRKADSVPIKFYGTIIHTPYWFKLYIFLWKVFMECSICLDFLIFCAACETSPKQEKLKTYFKLRDYNMKSNFKIFPTLRTMTGEKNCSYSG